MPLPLIPIFAALAAGSLGTAAVIGADRRARGTAKKLDDPLGYDTESKGAFMSALEYLGRPQKVLYNAAMGNFEGAGRQLIDVLGDTVDAFIPGIDLIPEMSRKMDKPEFSDVAGGMDPGWAKTAVDIGGGVLTDPLAFVPGKHLISGGKAVVGGVGSLGKMAVGALPNGAEKVAALENGAASLVRGVKSTFGAQSVSPATRALVDEGTAAGSLASLAQTQAMAAAVKGMSEAERKTAFRVVSNFKMDGAGKAVPILEDSVPLAATADDVARGGLVGIAPDAGQMVQPLRASDAYLQVKAPGKARGPIDVMDAGLGIKGVDVPNQLVQSLRPNLPGAIPGPASGIHGTGSSFDTFDAAKGGGFAYFHGPESAEEVAKYAATSGGGRRSAVSASDMKLTSSSGSEYLFDGSAWKRVKTGDSRDPGPVTLSQEEAARLSGGNGDWTMEVARPRTVERDLSKANFLDLESPEGQRALLSLGLRGLPSGYAHGRLVDGNTALQFWNTTKSGREWDQYIPKLKELGYQGISHNDVGGRSFAVFDMDVANRVARPDAVAKIANASALKTLDIAYPKYATEGKFLSGIELANKGMMGAAAELPAAMRGSKALGPLPKVLTPEGMDAPGLNYLSGRGGPAVAKAAEKPAVATFDTVDGHMARFSQRMAADGVEGAARTKMEAYFAKRLPIVQIQYREAVEKGAFSRVPGIDITREMPIDYVQRQFTGMLDETSDLVEGSAQAGKARTLRSHESFLDHMNNPENAGVRLEDDIAKADLFRAEQSGRMTQSAHIGRELIERTAKSAADKQFAERAGMQASRWSGAADIPTSLTKGEQAALEARYKAFNEPGVGAALKNILDEMKVTAPEDAQVFRDAIFGLAPRGAVSDFLAKTLKPFKAAAVYGYVIPKFGNIVRNRIGGIWQAASSKDTRAAVPGMVKRLGSDLSGAVADSLNLRIGRDKFSKILGDWEDALRTSQGSSDAALATMAAKHPAKIIEVLRRGILDGFTSAEQMLTEMGKVGWKQKYANVADWPGRIFRGVEDRMRLGMAIDLIDAGKSADEAVMSAGEALYKYNVSSVANREARTYIPFFQFVAKAIPQQAKFLANNPPLLSGIQNAMSQGTDGPIFPQMSGKLNIAIGQDENGDAQYLSGLGLPFEALGAIPNISGGFRDFGRDVERSIVGSANPVLKTAYSMVSGREPYFGSGYASYGKIPGNVDAGAAGRGYNALVGTGLIQPLASLGQFAGNLIDDRKSGIEKTLAMLSPAKIQSVNEDRALQAQLQATLERNPQIKRFTTPYAAEGDVEGQRLVEELREVGKRIRAKREAANAPR